MDSESPPRADLGRVAQLQLTYPEVGGTEAAELPDGYHHVVRRAGIGHGRHQFETASKALLDWQMHRRAGLGVHASGPAARDAVAILRFGVGPFAVSAAVRVVYGVDEPGRRGFAYGTLPGHPERGEESFVVELGADDEVTLAITAFSRPATLLARAAGPAGRLAQHRITTRYLRALRE